jgi:hypothetical protein
LQAKENVIASLQAKFDAIEKEHKTLVNKLEVFGTSISVDTEIKDTKPNNKANTFAELLKSKTNKKMAVNIDLQPILDEIKSNKALMSLTFNNLVTKRYPEARNVANFSTLKTGITCGDVIGFNRFR